MKKRRGLIYVLLTCLVFVLAAFPVLTGCSEPEPAPTPAPTPAPQFTEKVEIKFVAHNALALDEYQTTFDLIERIRDKSDGMINFTLLGGAEVVPAFEQAEAAKAGVVDACWIPAAYGTGIVPEGLALTNIPMNSMERREAGIEDLLNEIFQKNNLYYLMNCNPSGYPQMYHLFLNTEIDEPEDLNGLTMRTSAAYKPMLEYFSAATVGMPPQETYTAMERGLVDGFVFPADSPVFNFSMQEVTKYYVNPGFGSPQHLFIFNLDKWNSLPDNVQKFITDMAIEQEWTKPE